MGATSNTYLASGAGNFTVSVTNSFGCSATSAAQSIVVSQNPIISGVFNQGPNIVCEGGLTLFTSFTSGATSYQWNLNNNPIVGANATTFTAFQGGVYTLTATNQNGCSGTSSGLTFEVLGVPFPVIIPTINEVLTGSTAVFQIEGADGAASYQWMTNPLNTGWINVPDNVYYSGGTEDNLIISNVSIGSHLQPFQVTVSNGVCEGTSPVAYISILDSCVNTVTVYDTTFITVTDTLIIDVNFVGIDESTYQNTILIYPNPTNDHITIDYGNYELMLGYELRIYNPMGQIVHYADIVSQSQYIDLNTWGSAGVYQVIIYDGQGVPIETRQIVLQ
jgi:hypothetical protein